MGAKSDPTTIIGLSGGIDSAVSAALAVSLAKGMSLRDSVKFAKEFVEESIRKSQKVGKGIFIMTAENVDKIQVDLADAISAFNNIKNIYNFIPECQTNFVFSKSITYTKAVKIIHYNVVTLAKLTWPDLVVLDGYYCMDGNGPVDGFPVQVEAAIASTDPLKADSVGARLMGLQPESIGYLYYLGQEKWGDYSLNGLVGEKIENVKQHFKLHPTYNIQKNWNI